MIIQLIADASSASIDAYTVGQIISSVLGVGAVGGGAIIMSKAKQISVKMAEEYATKGDLRRVDDEIASIKSIQRAAETKAHERMDDMSKTLNSLDGKMDVLLKSLNIKISKSL